MISLQASPANFARRIMVFAALVAYRTYYQALLFLVFGCK